VVVLGLIHCLISGYHQAVATTNTITIKASHLERIKFCFTKDMSSIQIQVS
jgi:hypothetical protein